MLEMRTLLAEECQRFAFVLNRVTRLNYLTRSRIKLNIQRYYVD